MALFNYYLKRLSIIKGHASQYQILVQSCLKVCSSHSVDGHWGSGGQRIAFDVWKKKLTLMTGNT